MVQFPLKYPHSNVTLNFFKELPLKVLRNRITDVENKLMVIKGKGGGYKLKYWD